MSEKKLDAGLSELAKLMLARAGGRIIPSGHYGFPNALWVDINKLAEAQADMDYWVSNKLGDGDPMKDKPVYAWHRGRNGPTLCGAKMEPSPLEQRHGVPVAAQCDECKRIWCGLRWVSE